MTLVLLPPKIRLKTKSTLGGNNDTVVNNQPPFYLYFFYYTTLSWNTLHSRKNWHKNTFSFFRDNA